MYRYKIGDICPFCGQRIPGTATGSVLYAISLAAEAMKLPPPDNPIPDIECKLISNVCASGRFTDHRCCRACPNYNRCAKSCLNSPAHCNYADNHKLRSDDP